MSWHNATLLSVLSCILVLSPPAYAKTLIGKKAAAYIGDLKEKLTGSEYYAVVLERRNEDFATGNRVDAVIFSPLARTFHPIRSLDQDHALTLNAPDGKAASRVSLDNFSHYQELIRENRMDPEVIIDKDGSELFIAYCGLEPCRIVYTKKKDGRLNIEVRRFLIQQDRDVFLRIPHQAGQDQ